MREYQTSADVVSLDELDRRIINHLQEDGRRPYTDIAHLLEVSETTVRKRVNRLINAGAMQIVAAVDPLALGYVRAEVGIRVSGPSIRKVSHKLEAVPEVSYIQIVLGAYDLSISVTCRSNDHLLQVMDGTILAIPGVEKVEAFTVLEVTKDVYRWPTASTGETPRSAAVLDPPKGS